MAYWRAARRKRRLAAAGCILILLTAVLPNVFYVGHWAIPGVGRAEHIDTTADALAHAQHCHLGPSSCSDHPSLVGAWWIGDAVPAIAIDALLRGPASAAVQNIYETPASVPTPPPRTA